jgi:hypothetical protein
MTLDSLVRKLPPVWIASKIKECNRRMDQQNKEYLDAAKVFITTFDGPASRMKTSPKILAEHFPVWAYVKDIDSEKGYQPGSGPARIKEYLAYISHVNSFEELFSETFKDYQTYWWHC